MSVDFLVCNNCGDTFADCGDFVRCESCGTNWCSDDCAESDGFERESCKLGCSLNYGEPDGYDENCICKDKLENDEDVYCCDCPNYIPESCNFCRHEDYNDETLLDKTLNLLGMSRDELIKRINKDNGRI
jgi:hypothetical protein